MSSIEEKSVSDAQNDPKFLKEEIENLTKKLEDSQKANEILEAENHVLNDKLAEKTKRVKQIENNMDQLIETNTFLTKQAKEEKGHNEIKDLGEKNKVLEKKLSMLEIDLSEVKDQLRSVNKHIKTKLTAEVSNSIMQSTLGQSLTMSPTLRRGDTEVSLVISPQDKLNYIQENKVEEDTVFSLSSVCPYEETEEDRILMNEDTDQIFDLCYEGNWFSVKATLTNNRFGGNNDTMSGTTATEYTGYGIEPSSVMFEINTELAIHAENYQDISYFTSVIGQTYNGVDFTKIIAIGGQSLNDNITIDRVYLINTKSGKVLRKNPRVESGVQLKNNSEIAHASRHYHAAVRFACGYIFIHGGKHTFLSGEEFLLDDACILNFEEDEKGVFQTICKNNSKKPEARYKHTAQIFDGMIILYGGLGENDKKLFDIWSINYKEKDYQWTEIKTNNYNICKQLSSYSAYNETNESLLVLTDEKTPKLWELKRNKNNFLWQQKQYDSKQGLCKISAPESFLLIFGSEIEIMDLKTNKQMQLNKPVKWTNNRTSVQLCENYACVIENKILKRLVIHS